MIGVPVLSLSDTLLRLGLATLLGALVGLERERLERAAGLRTHAIVSLGSALIMLVSMYGFSDVLGADQRVGLDVSRVAAQVVSGIGFLGAGVIIFRKSVVRGLTTAASIWTVAGLGLACGGGLFAAAGIATGMILALQLLLRPLEQRYFSHHHEHRLELRVQRSAGNLSGIQAAIDDAGVSIKSLRVRPANGGEDRVDIVLGPVADTHATRLLEHLREVAGVQLVAYSMDNQPPSGASPAENVSDED